MSKPSAEQGETRWYGEAIVGTDLAALGLTVLGLTSLSPSDTNTGWALLAGGGLTYLAGGPIVHAVHGKADTAVGSLVIRIMAPLAGAYIGVTAGSGHCTGDDCSLDGLASGLVGFGAGMLVASIIDISALPYEAKPEPAAPRVALVPNIDPKRGVGLNLFGVW